MLKDLTAVLVRYPAAVQPLDQPEDLGGAGGLSGAKFWRYRSGMGTLLARVWPTDGPPLPVLERIHSWLAELTTLGYFQAFAGIALPNRASVALHESVGFQPIGI